MTDWPDPWQRAYVIAAEVMLCILALPLAAFAIPFIARERARFRKARSQASAPPPDA